MTEPYTLLCTYTVQIVLSILTALIAVIIAYGAIGATIIGLLGPVFIPWMVFGKTDFLFWGWLKAFLGFEFYKVVAAATMSVMSHLLIPTSPVELQTSMLLRDLIFDNAGIADVVLCRGIYFAQDPRHDCHTVLRPYRRS